MYISIVIFEFLNLHIYIEKYKINYIYATKERKTVSSQRTINFFSSTIR